MMADQRRAGSPPRRGPVAPLRQIRGEREGRRGRPQQQEPRFDLLTWSPPGLSTRVCVLPARHGFLQPQRTPQIVERRAALEGREPDAPLLSRRRAPSRGRAEIVASIGRREVLLLLLRPRRSACDTRKRRREHERCTRYSPRRTFRGYSGCPPKVSKPRDGLLIKKRGDARRPLQCPPHTGSLRTHAATHAGRLRTPNQRCSSAQWTPKSVLGAYVTCLLKLKS